MLTRLVGALSLLFLVALASCDRKTSVPLSGGDSAVAPSGVSLVPLPPVAERTAASDFAGATAWLNTDRALVPADLDGRVVVIDFWTSCCINCLHTLPILTEVEKKYSNQPVLVIGVHSPKFDAETESERLHEAIAENDITHPVAVDGSMKVWNAWKAEAWPTILVLDAKRRIVWRHSGEPSKAELEGIVESALAEGRHDGILKNEKLAALKPETTDTGPLAFPGKIALLDGGMFAVSDTGHHRVVVFDAAFTVKDVIGTGLAGMTDGAYVEASFKKPQGLAVIGDRIYVADTENHALRVIDRKAKTVTTVAGTGEISHVRFTDKGKGRETALRSPWDLVAVKDKLYVALAGAHVIALFDPAAGTIEPWAGDGVERRYDNTGTEASFAQPSGLTTDGTTIWSADSETSSIRAIDIASRKVKTLVGKDLFVFGDVDGSPDVARLEHPLGVSVLGGALFVADTYNSKIKRLDLATSSTRSLVGARDHKDLFEPSGLVARMAGKETELVVVDTKHHRLARVISSNGGDVWKVEPITIKGLTAPTRGIAIKQTGDTGPAAPTITIAASDLAVRASGGTLRVSWDAPKGTGVNEDAPFKIRWKKTDGLAETPADLKTTGATVKAGFPLSIKPSAGATHAKLEGELDMVVCDIETHAICVPLRRGLDLGFAVTKDGPAETDFKVKLPEAKAPR